jgi:hypothetical protein
MFNNYKLARKATDVVCSEQLVTQFQKFIYDNPSKEIQSLDNT